MNPPDVRNQVVRANVRFRSTLLRLGVVSAVAVTMAWGPLVAESRVIRFVVDDRQSYAGGAEFGTSGPFERVLGTAYMEVDPADPLNAIIVNLDNAPKNALGMVEFSAPFWIIKRRAAESR